MRSLLVLVALAASMVVACGRSSLTRAAGPAMAAAGPAPASGHAATASVRIVDFAYKPRTLRVRVGARVVWRNADTTNHTVTFGRGGPRSIGNLQPRAHTARAFSRTGRFKYVCAFHPFMHGTVVVTR